MLFKFTDALSGAMTAPFVIDLGFTRNEYAAIVKGVGLAATLVGGFAGGFVARAYPLATSLWIGGIVQALANLSFSWLAVVGLNQWALAFAIIAENFTSAIGTVIFVAYLSALCQNPLHTATQYALLTALAAVGRTYLSSGAGYRRRGDRLDAVLRDLRAGRLPEPDAARLAAAARAFRGAGAGERLSASSALVVTRGSGRTVFDDVASKLNRRRPPCVWSPVNVGRPSVFARFTDRRFAARRRSPMYHALLRSLLPPLAPRQLAMPNTTTAVATSIIRITPPTTRPTSNRYGDLARRSHIGPNGEAVPLMAATGRDCPRS